MDTERGSAGKWLGLLVEKSHQSGGELSYSNCSYIVFY